MRAWVTTHVHMCVGPSRPPWLPLPAHLVVSGACARAWLCACCSCLWIAHAPPDPVVVSIIRIPEQCFTIPSRLVSSRAMSRCGELFVVRACVCGGRLRKTEVRRGPLQSAAVHYNFAI